MKMRLLTYSTAVICAVFIITGAVSGKDVKKAVGEKVSFGPDKLESSVTSITWKQRTSSGTVKVIEWDPEETDPITIPVTRFKDITKLDEKTGIITITNLKMEHSGTYTIDINSKEQPQSFSLEVMEPVPKPNITIEKTSNPDVAYLKCEHSGTIIWKNSSGETLEGNKNHTLGESITVENTKYPENFYTCTLKNAVSEETSDRVYERDMFKIEPVPKPVIKTEKSGNPDVAYLRCEYSGTIIWKNSSGETLPGQKNHTLGESITVKNTRNPGNFYTCSLKNAVSEETSEAVYERDMFKQLFKTEGGPWWIALIVLFLILLAAPIVLYKFCPPFHDFVYESFKDKPCIGAILKILDGEKKSPGTAAEANPLKSSRDAENGESVGVNTKTETQNTHSDGGEESVKL